MYQGPLQKNFGASGVGASHQYRVVLFSSFYLLKMLFFAISEVLSWSSGRQNFGYAFTQLSILTYIFKFWSQVTLEWASSIAFIRYIKNIQLQIHHQLQW